MLLPDHVQLLRDDRARKHGARVAARIPGQRPASDGVAHSHQDMYGDHHDGDATQRAALVAADSPQCIEAEKNEKGSAPRGHQAGTQQGRSEEHTSELQSLMRTSYAVFCLKKKTKKKNKNTTCKNKT